MLPAARLCPSRLALRLTALLYLAGMMIPLHLPWPLPARLALAALVLIDGWLWRRRLKRCHGVAALRVTPDHRLQIEEEGRPAADPGWKEVALRPGCLLWPWLMVLHVRRPERRRTERWLLLPDMMSRDEWRRLRVWVRWRLPELMPRPPDVVERLKAWAGRLYRRNSS